MQTDDIAGIAAGLTLTELVTGLHPADKAAIVEDCSSIEICASVSSLMSLCLSGLAMAYPDSSVALTPLGLQVREYLTTGNCDAT